jgi:hypothetical protein
MTGQSNRDISKFGRFRPDGIRQRPKIFAQIVRMGIRVSHPLSRVLVHPRGISLGSFPPCSGLGKRLAWLDYHPEQAGLSCRRFRGPEFAPAIMNLKKSMYNLVYIKLFLRDRDQNGYRDFCHFFLSWASSSRVRASIKNVSIRVLCCIQVKHGHYYLRL